MLPILKTVFDGKDRNFIIASPDLDLGGWSNPEVNASARNNPEDVLTNRQLEFLQKKIILIYFVALFSNDGIKELEIMPRRGVNPIKFTKL